jgi:hypothetical protein
MIRYIAIIFLFISIDNLHSQSFSIYGQVINKQTSTFLIGCSVYNVTKQLGTVTNDEGRFKISVEKGDLIQFTYLGMGVQQQYAIDNSDMMVEMTYQTRRMKPVTIKAEVEAKKSVLYNKNYEKNKEKTFKEPIRRTAKEMIKQSLPNFKTGELSFSPFSLLYYSNKRVQRRMSAIIDIDKLDASNQKYTLDFISLVTKVEDIDELKDIKAHCYFPHDEVLNASFYELGLKLQECYIEYLEIKKSKPAVDSIPRDE